ncbi:MAG TPA: MATE family efflux transporter [Clostridia bacterium]|nr:MATE family efflux transporter [Clostridia bacterium]
MENELINNENPLGTEPVGGLLQKYAIPSIVAMLVGALYNIVDQFFIGQKIGELGNAATNVAFPLSTACVAIALLLGVGGAAAFNLTMGEGDKEKAVYYIGNATVMLFILGLALSIITQIFLTPMLKFFGSPDNVLGYARVYTRITSLGFPFLIVSNGGGHLIRADGSPSYAMFANLLGAVINTVLDPIFIFVFNMDMAGAALATVIGQIFSFLMAARYFRNFKSVHIQKHHFVPVWKYIKRITTLGAAPSFNQVAMMIVQIIMNKSLTHYGAMSVYGKSIPLAAAGIINKVAMIFFSVIIGISQGMQPIASFNYGARKFDRVKGVYKLAIRSGFVISTVAFLSFQVIPRQIISIFGSGSKEYFDFAVSYFRIYMLFTFINCVQPVSSNLFTAIGKPKKGIFLSLTRQIIFLLPFILILPLLMGIDGIMYAGPIADLAAAIVSGIMVIVEFRNMGKISLAV